MHRFFLIFLLLPVIVCAKSYTIDQVNINAEILSDGNIWITEARTYTFNGSYSWADYHLSLDKLGDVKMFSLREGSQNFYEGSDESPGSYYIEKTEDSFYVKWFYQAEDQTRTFVLKYLVTDAITVYDDVAQLYYKFIGTQNPKDLESVFITIKLPRYASEDSVKIWAHGPLHGLINFKNGNVESSISPMPAEQFFEARVVFPPHWVPLAQKIVHTTKLPQILEQETRWAKQANLARQKAQEELRIKRQKEEQILPWAIVISVLSLIIILWFYRKYGTAFSVPYDLKVDSQIPTNIHPAILSSLYFNKQVYGSAISATIFELARREIITMEQKKPVDKKWWQPKYKYIFKLNRSGWNEIRNQMKDFENNLLDFFFNTLAKGSDTIDTALFKKSSSKMQKWFQQWKTMVKRHIKDIKLYDKKSIRYTVVSAVFSFIVLVSGILMLIFIGYPGILLLGSGLICLALSFAILRYTKDMKLKRKKWEALRTYLRKYHFIKDPNLEWQSKIGLYLVYGLALGVSKTAFEKMIIKIPQEQHGVLFPWYIYAAGGSSNPADFASAVTSVVSAASTSVSSASGAGGGASAGGGGGAGGAGGGAG